MARVISSKGKPVSKNNPVDVEPFVKAAKKGKVLAKEPKKAGKATAKAEASAPPASAPDASASRGDGKAFSKEELGQLELLQLRMTTVQQTVELANRNLEAFVRDAQEKIKLAQSDVSLKQAEAQKRAEELMGLYRNLEEKYGIKMRDITYDPASGKIMAAPPGMLDAASKQ